MAVCDEQNLEIVLVPNVQNKRYCPCFVVPTLRQQAACKLFAIQKGVLILDGSFS